MHVFSENHAFMKSSQRSYDRSIVEEQEFPNAPEVQTQRESSHVGFYGTIRMLCQVATHQVAQKVY